MCVLCCGIWGVYPGMTQSIADGPALMPRPCADDLRAVAGAGPA
jgi:hypothetical protein